MLHGLIRALKRRYSRFTNKVTDLFDGLQDLTPLLFVLPWQGKTLIGTTEVRQKPSGPISCSTEELDYLLNVYNHYRTTPVSQRDVIERFAGVRPLLLSTEDPNKATREYAIHHNNNLMSVFGGKWTTTLALAQEVTRRIQ